jgi:MFS family permease
MSEHTPPESTPPRKTLAGGIGRWGRNTFAALSVRNFRLFYLGQGISLVGTWMRRTALGWYTYELTGSYKLLGIVMGMALLPMFVLAPIAGSLADRMEKRRLIIASQYLALVVSSILALVVWLGVAQVWSLILLAALTGVAFSFEVPARQAFVFEMVGRERLMNAIALNSALVNLSRIFGPALAGLLLGWFGASLVFAADAASYIIIIITLYMISVRGEVVEPPRGSRLQHLAEGWKEVVRNLPVRNALLLLFLVTSLGWSYNTLLPAIAQDILHLGPTRYGYLMSMFGLGAIGGALYVAEKGARSKPRGQMYSGILTMITALTFFSVFHSFPAMSVSLIFAGFGGILFLSTANTLIQTSVEDRIRGRVMGIWSLMFGGSLPLGSFVAGWIASKISPFTTIQLLLLLCAVGCSVILMVTNRVRKGTQPEAASVVPQESVASGS